MTPAFDSVADYRAARGDVVLWRPHLEAAVGPGRFVAAGNATYPTFLRGDRVVKFFGFVAGWEDALATERAALEALSSEPAVPAPRLVAAGEAGWPYLVLERVPGVAVRGARPSVALAAELGEIVRRLHEVAPSGLAARDPGDIAAAAAGSSLPAHLAAQAAAFVARVPLAGAAFVHGDLVGAHVFAADGHVTGLVDWGDALVADPHVELIQVYRDLFDCDAALLRAFLDGYGWPRDAGFARRALAGALVRQADGVARHLTMDVFEPVAERVPLAAIPTLDALAERLFGVGSC